jgi:LPPG:FO 2-phospho-L-lactate transferase
VAISPIIGGRALKGPADRMMQTLGHEPTALGVARLYEGLIDGYVVDHVDADQAPEIESELGIAVFVTDAIMHDIADRGRLAREALTFAESLHVRATA